MMRAECSEGCAMDLLGGNRWLAKSASIFDPIVMMKRCVILIVFLLGCAGPELERRSGKFARRAPRREALSPAGGYVVAAETPNRNRPQRNIVITRPGVQGEVLRYPFMRHVDVVWAPDESAVAVVDLVLENETRVVVFKLPGGEAVLELRREHVCELNPELPCGISYSHVYFSNVIWLAPDRIQVTVDMMNPLERELPPQIRGTLEATFGP